MASHATSMVGWVALTTGGVGLLAILFIILLYTVNSVFGPLNDICNGLLGILSGVLAAMLYAQVRAQSPLLSLVGLVLALAGAGVVVLASALVVSGRTGWYRAGFYTMAGFAGIGPWLMGQNLVALRSSAWSQSLVIAGLIVGGLMALGLAALPGLFSDIDSWEASPWYLKYAGMSASSLGWLVLYPLWCLWLGLMFLLTQGGRVCNKGTWPTALVGWRVVCLRLTCGRIRTGQLHGRDLYRRWRARGSRHRPPAEQGPQQPRPRRQR